MYYSASNPFGFLGWEEKNNCHVGNEIKIKKKGQDIERPRETSEGVKDTPMKIS